MGRIIEVGVCVQHLVAQILIAAAMEAVSSSLCGDVYHPASEEPELGSQIVGLYLELLDEIFRWHQRREVDIVDVDRSSIYICGALVRGPASDLVVAPCNDVAAGRVGKSTALR